MKTFFKEFKLSLTNPHWYHEQAVGKHPLRFGYLGIISTIAGFILSIGFGIALYTILIPEARNFVTDTYPADLVVTISKGELSTNQFGPYAIPVPADTKLNSHRKAETRTNLLLIDPMAEATLDATTKYDTYVFVNKTTMITEGENGKVEAIPLKDFPDFTISREVVVDFFDKLSGFAWILPIVFFIFLSIIIFVILLAMSFFCSVVLWLILKATSHHIKFVNAFKVSMYAYTFVLVIDLVAMIIGFRSLGFWASILITNAVACLFIFNYKEKHITTN